MRTGPLPSMSSRSRSEARVDMFLRNFSRSASGAPFKANFSELVSISFSSRWMPRSSRSSRLSNRNISSMMLCARSLLCARTLSIATSSCAEFIRFRISAAVCTPPILLRRRFCPSSMLPSTSVSSCSAAGCTPLKVAMRSTTSLRSFSSKLPSTSAAWRRSRCTRIVAMICGCSSRIISDTVEASIRLSASMPELAPLLSRMSSSRLAARSAPSARSSTARMCSVEFTLSAAYCSVSSWNSSSTRCMSSWETLSRRAISWLTSWTSRAGSCRSTIAALSSSSASNRIALRRRLLMFALLAIAPHPTAENRGHHGRVLLGHFLQVLQAVLVARGLAPRLAWRGVAGCGVRVRLAGRLTGRRGAAEPALPQRFQDHAIQHDRDDQHQQVAAQRAQQAHPVELLPPRFLVGCIGHDAERTVDHRQRVAALLGKTHRLAREILDLFHGGGVQRDGFCAAVFLLLVAIIDHHRHRQALHRAQAVLGVRDVAIHFVIGGAFAMQVAAQRVGIAGGPGGFAAGGARGRGAAGRIVDRGRRRARRGIGQRAGNAARTAVAIRAREIHLMTAHRGRIAALVGPVVLVGFLAVVEVDLRGDLRVHVAGAEDRRQDVFDALLITMFDLAHVVELGAIEVGVGAVARQ